MTSTRSAPPGFRSCVGPQFFGQNAGKGTYIRRRAGGLKADENNNEYKEEGIHKPIHREEHDLHPLKKSFTTFLERPVDELDPAAGGVRRITTTSMESSDASHVTYQKKRRRV